MKVKWMVEFYDPVSQNYHVNYFIADDENLYVYYNDEDKIIINRMRESSCIRCWHTDLYRVFNHYHPNCDIVSYKKW